MEKEDGNIKLQMAEKLKHCWVVILPDPSFDDWDCWSPWSVRATSMQDAIDKAKTDWKRWAFGPDLQDDDLEQIDSPEVLKVYENAWLGERVDENQDPPFANE